MKISDIEINNLAAIVQGLQVIMETDDVHNNLSLRFELLKLLHKINRIIYDRIYPVAPSSDTKSS